MDISAAPLEVGIFLFLGSIQSALGTSRMVSDDGDVVRVSAPIFIGQMTTKRFIDFASLLVQLKR